MTRGRYLILIFLTVVLIILTIQQVDLTLNKWRLAGQLSAGLLAWVTVWLRLRFLKIRQELAILPALPLLLAPINDYFFHSVEEGSSMPFYHYIMILAWVGAAAVLIPSMKTDEPTSDGRRADGVTIMFIVFICYFSLSFITEHIGRLIGVH